MHHRLTQKLFCYVVAPGLLFLTLGGSAARADDSGFFGRLFRFGSASAPSGNTSPAPNQNGSLPYSSNSAHQRDLLESRHRTLPILGPCQTTARSDRRRRLRR